jgi:predicted dehydrogenase
MGGFRAVIVGAGSMGRAWGRNLRDCEETSVVGWVDIRPGAADAAADELEFRGVLTGDDLGKALSDTRPDFVVDVTVPEAHHDVTLQALAAGVPVLGEKPMAHSMEAAREMVAASETAGRLYMVSQSRRYDARIEAYRRLIHSVCCPVGILNADFYIGAHFGGFRDEMESPLILDMAIHTFDQARFLSGRDAVSVYCEEFNPEWSWYRGDASATALFEMEGGLRYTYRGSWCAEGLHTSWEGQWRAVGPRGTATWDGDRCVAAGVVVEPAGFHSRTEERTEAIEEGVPSGIAGSLRDFLNALRTGETPMGECHDNIRSLAMVFGAIESSRSGRRVRIPD